MAVTAFFYGLAHQSAWQGKINATSDTLKVMLCTSGYTPSQDTHQFKSDITSEVAGTGYTAGGNTLTTVALAYTGATNTLKLSADNVTWSSSTITARYAVIYDSTPATDATRPLIGYVDFGADVSSSNGPFTITWNAAGVATVTVS